MNRYNQVPHMNRDSIWESDKNARKHHTQENQKVSDFLSGDHKAASNKQTRNNKHETTLTKESTKEAPPWNGQ